MGLYRRAPGTEIDRTPRIVRAALIYARKVDRYERSIIIKRFDPRSDSLIIPLFPAVCISLSRRLLSRLVELFSYSARKHRLNGSADDLRSFERDSGTLVSSIRPRLFASSTRADHPDSNTSSLVYRAESFRSYSSRDAKRGLFVSAISRTRSFLIHEYSATRITTPKRKKKNKKLYAATYER